MAVTVFTNAFFEVNALDLSSFVTDISPNYASEMLDETAMGDTTRIKKGGLKDWSFDATLHYDPATTTNPETVLWGLIGTTVCVEYRDINAAASAVNPVLSGVGVVENFNRGGSVGALLSATVRINSAGTLSRSSST